MSILNKLKTALSKTSDKIILSFAGKSVSSVFAEEIEDALIRADVGVLTAELLSKKITEKKFPKGTSDTEIKQFLSDEISEILIPYEGDLFSLLHFPEIIFIIGVNGNGKTTTVAKIANIFKELGHKPIVVAADTFRAAAVEQLQYWATYCNVDFFSGKENADPAGLVFDAIQIAKQKNNDIILIDTAGRMQNRKDLLAELEKIKRVVKKIDETAPHKTIMVLDGLTGQAAHAQVEVFLNQIGIDGIIVTKLDGTAKGGSIISLTQKYKLPIFAIGVGEKINDLKKFSGKEYANALLGIN